MGQRDSTGIQTPALYVDTLANPDLILGTVHSPLSTTRGFL